MASVPCNILETGSMSTITTRLYYYYYRLYYHNQARVFVYLCTGPLPLLPHNVVYLIPCCLGWLYAGSDYWFQAGPEIPS